VSAIAFAFLRAAVSRSWSSGSVGGRRSPFWPANENAFSDWIHSRVQAARAGNLSAQH